MRWQLKEVNKMQICIEEEQKKTKRLQEISMELKELENQLEMLEKTKRYLCNLKVSLEYEKSGLLGK
jgi:hypothetical protein